MLTAMLCIYDVLTQCVHHTRYVIIKKVKQSHYRPGQAQRVLRNLSFPRFRYNGTGWW